MEQGTTLQEEPKLVVFYTQLLSLFSFCFHCKAENPAVHMEQSGTMVKVFQNCNMCKHIFQWQSQPFIFGKYPAGNVLLSFATLMAGASISKLLLIFKHMNMCVYNVRTFFTTKAFPVSSYFKTLGNLPVIFSKQDKKCKRCCMVRGWTV